MASITIRRLPESTKRRLRIRAARNGRSMEQEARELLETGLARADSGPGDIGEAIRRRFAPLGGVTLNIPPRGPIREPGVSREQLIRDSFASQGLMRTIGAEISAIGEGHLELRFTHKPTLTQQNGFIHAGAVASVMDSACGYAAWTIAPENHNVLSVEFKVNLLAPAAGENFVVRSEVKRAGKTLTIVTADAFAINAGKEKPIATMLATMINRPE